MNIRVFLVGCLALGTSIFVVVKFLGEGPSKAATQNPNLLEEKSESEKPLPIAKSGPQPKVSVSEVDFQFGRMRAGEERSHTFTINNIGQAPLTIKMGKTTCQCTYGDMKEGEMRKILPGESQKIKLTWKPEFETDDFSKGADIYTDDPDEKRQKISLRAVGKVASLFVVRPQRDWLCPDIIDKPVICTGVVGSGILMDFKITSVESRGTPVEFELGPLEGDDLKGHQSAFGYHVNLTIPTDVQMGSFVMPVTIKTNVPEEGEHAAPGKLTEFEVLVSGVRRGPIRLAGPEWIDDKMGIALGSFESTVGKQLKVPMFIRNQPAEGFQLTKPPEVVPPDLKVEVVREDKPDGKAARYFLKLEYPAGAPRVSHRNDNPGKIRLFTNHPQAPELELIVYIASY